MVAEPAARGFSGSVIGVADSVSVGELCAAIDFAIATCFPDEIWVTGAVSGIRRTKPGHVYFDFIDPSDIGHAPGATI
ncbi:MAG: exodeoxyribonuclease VII large subunit, partial [Acidimicrobiales bacterium]